jgi:hypothetical protein
MRRRVLDLGRGVQEFPWQEEQQTGPVGWRAWVLPLGAYGLIFLILTWRLFAFGSREQLFLYGDNLSTYNNLFYIFSHFHWLDPFSTFVGRNGMLGSYVMSEPQNSIFYPPTFLGLVTFRTFHLGRAGLYNLLLLDHTLHFLCGVFVVNRIAARFLRLPGPYAFAAGLCYLGIGWNVGWFGTNTLSYMVAMVPLTMYVFLRYVELRTLRSFLLLVATMAAFLYAGGIVNYFLYLLLNLAAFMLLLARWPVGGLARFRTLREWLQISVPALVVAPLWSLAIYLAQLTATRLVAGDVTHATGGYDALAFTGSHFSDLAGLVAGKFGMVGYGTTSTPRLLPEFSGPNLNYVGMLPLILLVVAIVALRGRERIMLAGLAGLNLILAFGGNFFLYDMTYALPGTSAFRGHYKYLTFVGLYLALLVAVVLAKLASGDFRRRAFWTVCAGWTAFVALLGIAGVIVEFGAVAARAVKTRYDVDYHTLVVSAGNYLFRAFLVGVLSVVALYFFVRARSAITYGALILVLLLDTSVNFKYGTYYNTSLNDLTSTSFFGCCRNAAVLNGLNGFSQTYLIPEVVGVNPLVMYTAIPNKYVLDFADHTHLLDAIGNPNSSLFYAAGLDGYLSTSVVNLPNFPVASRRTVTDSTYQRYYAYNPSGDIHTEWGGGPSLVGSEVTYYRLSPAPDKVYVAPTYKRVASPADAVTYLEGPAFQPDVPVVIGGPAPPSVSSTHVSGTDIGSVTDRPTQKRFELQTPSTGILFVNVPYARMWHARVDGRPARVLRANLGFSAVDLGSDPVSVVDFYVDRGPLRRGGAEGVLALLLIPGAILGRRWWRRRAALVPK